MSCGPDIVMAADGVYGCSSSCASLSYAGRPMRMVGIGIGLVPMSDLGTS